MRFRDTGDQWGTTRRPPVSLRPGPGDGPRVEGLVGLTGCPWYHPERTTIGSSVGTLQTTNLYGECPVDGREPPGQWSFRKG